MRCCILRVRPSAAGATAAVALLFSVTAAAATESLDAHLAPIVVTAARMAQTADQSLASVSVITRADIEREQPQDVLDALNALPGVEITRQGGYGKLSSVFLRGTNSNQVLVLVDGVPVGSVTSGAASWEFIPIDLIQRIEVVRGPLSSLYGANAVGGVIQIFTRAAEHRREADASVSGGTYGTGSAHAGAGFSQGRTRLRADLSLFHTDGFNSRDNVNGVFEPDADGYQNEAFSIGFSQGLRERDRLQLRVLRAQGYTEFDPSFSPTEANRTNFVQQVLSADYRLAVGDMDTVTVRAGQSQDKRETFRDGGSDPHVHFDSTRNHFSLINTVLLGSNSINVGADYQNERLDSSTDFNSDSRDTYGVFAEYGGHFGRQDAQLSVRHDEDQAFGGYTTGSIAWGFDITPRYRVTASWGSAFKAPSFNDLYFPGFSNPDLEPEKSHSTELGLRGQQSWGQWSLRVYQTRIRDLITLGPAPDFQPINLNRARIRGVELELKRHVGNWRINAGGSYLQPIDLETDSDLPRRPRTSAHLDVDRDLGAWSVGASVDAHGPAYDDAANTVRLPGYAVFSLRAAYRVTPSWTVSARLANVFNRHYETIYGYHSAGAAGYLTVAWHFQPAQFSNSSASSR